MKVAIKLALALLPCAVVVLALSGWLSIQRELTFISNDARSETQTWGLAIAELARHAWRTEGPVRARRLVEQLAAGLDQPRLRWVWVGPEGDAPSGDELPLLPLDRLDPLRDDGQVVVHLEPAEGAAGRVLTYVPVLPAAPYALELEESLAQHQAFLRDSQRQVVGLTLVMAVLLCALSVVAGLHMVGRPMQRLLEVARRVGEGDFSRRVLLPQRDEIGALAREMNAMCERLLEARLRLEEEVEARLEALQRLRHADRLATLGQIAAGLAHEVGTPLSVAKGWAELIAAGDLPPGEVRQKAEKVVELCQRISRTIRLTLDFARRRAPHTASNELRRLTRRTLDLLDPLAQRHDVELVRVAGPPVLAEVDGGQIEQVVTNLVVNAIYASPAGGAVEVDVRAVRRPPPADESLRAAPSPPQEWVCLVVRDGGEGITAEHLEHLWEPFFTTRPFGRGTGLGLPIARGIVEEHGGWIEVETAVGEGTTFLVFLPPQAGRAGEEERGPLRLARATAGEAVCEGGGAGR